MSPSHVLLGLELTFCQNVASRFLFTKNLVPILTPNASVINCLGAGQGSVLKTDDWQLQKDFNFMKAAGQYAAMTDFLALEWARRHPHAFCSFYPGVVNTKSVQNQHFPWIIQVAAGWVLPWIGIPPSQVAQVIFNLCSAGSKGLVGSKGQSLPLPNYIQNAP